MDLIRDIRDVFWEGMVLEDMVDHEFGGLLGRPEGSLGRRTKWAAFENRSTTIMIQVWPLDAGTL